MTLIDLHYKEKRDWYKCLRTRIISENKGPFTLSVNFKIRTRIRVKLQQSSFAELNSIESTESVELVEYYFQYFLFSKY